MLRILFTADDLLSTRFLPEPAPMLELKFAAMGLRRGIRASWGERWRSRALAAIPRSALPAVRQVGGHFSWALSPTFAAGADLDEGMETFLGFGTERLREEMALYFSAPNSGVPLWHAFEGDRDAGRVLMRGTKAAFAAAVRPYWDDLRANHHGELAHHGRLLAGRGMGAALTAAIPGATWSEACLRIDSPQDRTVRLGGRGLLVTPTAFWTGPPLVGELPDQPVLLAYPAPARLSLRVGPESDSLAAVLGVTRAAGCDCCAPSTRPVTSRAGSASARRRRLSTARRCERLAWSPVAATARP
jgi:hypothetical protein